MVENRIGFEWGINPKRNNLKENLNRLIKIGICFPWNFSKEYKVDIPERR